MIEHAEPFVVNNSTLYKSSLGVSQAASLKPSVSDAADGTGAPYRTRKAALSLMLRLMRIVSYH